MLSKLIRDVEANSTRINLANVAVCMQMLDKIYGVSIFSLFLLEQLTWIVVVNLDLKGVYSSITKEGPT